MGIIASCCAAAACSCCIGYSCTCCGLLVSISKSVATRVWYTAVFIMMGLLAWVLSVWGYDILSWIPWKSDLACSEEYCGVIAVYKATFGLFVFHFLLSLILIGVKSSKDVRAQLNDGWWGVKLPLLGLMIVGSFFIPYQFFTYYAWVAVFAAGLFILIQLVLLLDFAYVWNEAWVAKWQPDDAFGSEENNLWYVLLLGATVLMYGFAFVLDVLLLVLFSDCWYNVVLISLSIVGCAVLTLISLMPKVRELNPSVGLLQAGVFTAYCTYLLYSAILSEPEGCFRWDFGDSGATHSDWITLIFGGAFTVVSVVYSSLRIGSSDALSSADEPLLLEDAEEGLEEHEDDDCDSVDGKASSMDDERAGVKYNYSLFHLSFALGYMYMAMLLTNWSVISGETDSTTTDAGWVAVSVKLASAGVAGLLYLWAIFAPAVLKDREF